MGTEVQQVNTAKVRKFFELLASGGKVELALFYPTWKDRRVLPVGQAVQEALAAECDCYVQVHGFGPSANGSLSEFDIVEVRWLFVDVDPEREPHTSATEDQHAEAQRIGAGIVESLKALGWPDPIFTDSGNGAQLLWPCSIAVTSDNRAAVKELLARFVETVGVLHASEGFKIDASVAKLTQLCRVPGTVNRKPPDPRMAGVRLPIWAKGTERPEVSLEQIESFLGVKLADLPSRHIPTNPAAGGEINELQLARLLESMDPTEYRDHADWFKVLCSSHSATGGAGREVFVAWSTSDPKYREHRWEIIKRWNSLGKNQNGYRIGTLFHLARQTQTGAAIVNSIRNEIDESRGINAVQDLRNAATLNDIGNAYRFAQTYNTSAVYCDRIGWFVWDGSRWKLDPDGVRVQKLAMRRAKKLFSEFGAIQGDMSKDQKSYALRHCLGSSAASRVAAMIKLARSLMDVDRSIMDADDQLLNLENGTLDLRTGELREHTPEDYCTLKAAVEFDPAAECPLWLEQLELTFEDPQVARYLQVYLGSCLSGEAEKPILPICYGSGENGKNVIWETVFKILGDYAGTATAELLCPTRGSHPTEIMDLMGKRFVVVNETDSQAALKEDQVKALNDPKIKGRRMYQDFVEFRRTHKFWLCSNHRPIVTGTDDGVWRRLRLIPFERKMSDELKARGKSIVEGFSTKLMAEASGILNWLFEGYKLFKAHGIDHFEPTGVRLATEEYRVGENKLAGWLMDNYRKVDESKVPAADRKAGMGTVLTQELWDDFRNTNLTISTGIRRIAELKQQLEKLGFVVERCKEREHQFENKSIVRGLRKRDPFQDKPRDYDVATDGE